MTLIPDPEWQSLSAKDREAIINGRIREPAREMPVWLSSLMLWVGWAFAFYVLWGIGA